jgi:hypothetical protein
VTPQAALLPKVATSGLARAVEIYLGRAYPGGELPDAVARRLAWRDAPGETVDVAGPPFERTGRPEPGQPTIVALRLGNERYPHMKLQIQSWPNAQGFLLSVNTHDQILSMAPEGPDAEAARALQGFNQGLKESIEQAWDDAGLPTFLRYLRDYLEGQPPPPAAGELRPS